MILTQIFKLSTGRNPDKPFITDKALGNCQQVEKIVYCLLPVTERAARVSCNKWARSVISLWMVTQASHPDLGCWLWACACESSGHPDTIHRFHQESLAWPAHALLSCLHPVDSLASNAGAYSSGSWSVISNWLENRSQARAQREMGKVAGVEPGEVRGDGVSYILPCIQTFFLMCTFVFTTIVFIPWGWNPVPFPQSEQQQWRK